MLYSDMAEAYELMQQTTKRLELTGLLAGLLKRTPAEELNKVVYLTQGKLYPDHFGVEIGIAEKLAIKTIALSSGSDASNVEETYRHLGDMGSTAYELLRKKTQMILSAEPLSVGKVYQTLSRIARVSGQGSQDLKLKLLSSLLSDASSLEAKYIIRTVMGELRLGVADYTVLDALATAFAGEKESREILEKAYNYCGDLGEVAEAVATGGMEAARRFRIRLGRPIRPMLAERLETAQQVLEKLGGKCAAEFKLDGERLQIHKEGGKVALFSRRLENITSHYPDAIDICKSHVKSRDAILEAEAVAVNRETGEYLPFQELMHRRRKYGIEEAMASYPISLNFFDVLFAGGFDLTNEPYSERRKRLEKIVSEGDRVAVVPSKVTSDANEIDAFMGRAITEGCEGLVVKGLNSVYRAGARGFTWIKLKREYRSEISDTLDLVVVGALYGRGRRAGKYGAFLLAAYDREADTFRATCKVGTGFTDEDLGRFPAILSAYLLDHRHSRVDSRLEADVWFVPKMVIEIIASEITLSPIHTAAMGVIRAGSGLALRFPKFTGKVRYDKAPEDATTAEELLSMHRRQLRKVEGERSVKVGE